MDKVYYWAGRILIDGAAVFGVLVVFYFTAGLIASFWDRALRKYNWLNYRYYFVLKLFKTFVLGKDWLRMGSPQELAAWLRRHNDRANGRAKDMRTEAPFYRWLYAYIIRRNRRKWAASW